MAVPIMEAFRRGDIAGVTAAQAAMRAKGRHKNGADWLLSVSETTALF
jgi:hypothetical protein